MRCIFPCPHEYEYILQESHFIESKELSLKSSRIWHAMERIGSARPGKSLNPAMHLQPQTRLAMNPNLLLEISHNWPVQSLGFATLAGSSMMDK
jgi:hypothetical protein